METFTDFELTILKEISDPGSQPGLSWGAAMSVALGFLQGSGCVTRGTTPQITNKGKQALSDAA